MGLLTPRIRRTAAMVGLILGVGAGLGANAFRFAYNVVDRPLPYRDPGQLVALFQERTEGDFSGRWASVTPSELTALRASSDLFQGVEAYAPATMRPLGDTGGEIAIGTFTDGLPELFGVRPLLGRDFSALPVADRGSAVMLSEAYWRTVYQGDAAALGATLHVGGHPRTVVGVMPRTFRFLVEADAWLPSDGTGAAVGRLQQGIRRENINSLLGQQATTAPELAGDRVWVSDSFQDLREARVPTKVLATMYTVAALILLLTIVGAAGVGTQQTATHIDRLRTMATLGARRRDVVKAIVVQCFAPLVVAVPVAATASAAFSGMLETLTPSTLRWYLFVSYDPSLDWAAVALGVAVCGISWIAALAAPTAATWHYGYRTATNGAVMRDRDSTVAVRAIGLTVQVGQVALATVLIGATVVLANQHRRITGDSWGYQPAGLTHLSLRPGDTLSPTRTHRRIALDSLLASLKQSGLFVAVAEGAPPTSGATGQLMVDGHHQGVVQLVTFGVDYFPVVGMKMIAGRLEPKAASSATGSGCLVVVTPELIQRLALAHGESGVGRRFSLAGRQGEFEVAAVVASVRSPASHRGQPLVLQPESCDPRLAAPNIVLRGVPPADQRFQTTVQTVARQHGFDVRRVQSAMDENARLFEIPLFYVQLASVITSLALLVTVAGVYSVTSEKVRSMRPLFWLWFALGGSTSSVMKEAVRRETIPIVFGITLGLLCCYWLDGRVVDDLYHSSIRSPLLTLIAVTAGCALTAVPVVIAYSSGWRKAHKNRNAGLRCL